MSVSRRHAKKSASLKVKYRQLLDEVERLRGEVARLQGKGEGEAGLTPPDEEAVEDAQSPRPDWLVDVEDESEKAASENAAASEGEGGSSESSDAYAILEGKFQRLAADFENHRKRTARETERLVREQGEKFLRSLLPVVDNMERGLQHMEGDSENVDSLRQGVESTYAQFCRFLDEIGLEAIDALGTAFDPKLHDAMFQHPTNDVAPDHVAFEVEKGYMWGDKLLRPTRVGVAVPAPESADGKDAPEPNDTTKD